MIEGVIYISIGLLILSLMVIFLITDHRRHKKDKVFREYIERERRDFRRRHLEMDPLIVSEHREIIRRQLEMDVLRFPPYPFEENKEVKPKKTFIKGINDLKK